MPIEVIERGRRVRVTPDRPTAADVLEYAEALIEEEGWNAGATTKDKPMKESSTQTGWTLHDAIGEANRRLFPETRGGGGKEGIRIAGDTGETTRVAATNALAKELGGKDDKAFNDAAKDVNEVLTVLRRAREGLTV